MNKGLRQQLKSQTLAISTMMVLKTEDMVTGPSTDLHTELKSLPLREKTAAVRSKARGVLEELKLHC